MKPVKAPIGIYNSIKEWNTERGKQFYHSLYLKDIYQTLAISNDYMNRPPCPSTWFSIEMDGGYIYVLPNGRLWGVNGTILTPDNYLIRDVSFEGVHITDENLSIFKEKSLPPYIHMEKVADATHIYSNNYYHWMYEVLPRIHLVQKEQINVKQFIFSTYPNPYYQAETLNELGIKKKDILVTNSNSHIQAKNLVVPSQPLYPTKWAFDFLRNTFLKDNSKQVSNNKIFVSRKWSRKIINEYEFMELLSNYGFTKVELETLSVAEQVQLFLEADFIIGAHGAGLTNLTFCKPGTKIIEIFSPTYIIPHYWTISSFAGLNYHYFISNTENWNSQNLGGWPGGDNLIIDIPLFNSYLKNMNI